MSGWVKAIKRIRFEPESGRTPFFRQTSAYKHASVIVLCFYVFQLTRLPALYSNWGTTHPREFISPVWAVSFLSGLFPDQLADLTVVAYTLGLVSVILFREMRWARAMFAAGLFLRMAVENSYGKIDHGGHLTLFLAIVLIFLPNFRENLSRSARQRFLTVFATAQGVILSAYTLAGSWKVMAAITPKPETVLSLFSFGAFPAQIAASLLEKQAQSAPGVFLIEHPGLAWVVGLGGVYFEFFALAALLRPRLHVVFGLAIIFMHLGAIVFMRIVFAENILLLGLFLCASPFSTGFDARMALARMPPLGWLVSLIRQSKMKGFAALNRHLTGG